MKFVADMGIPPRAVDFLRRLGYDAVHFAVEFIIDLLAQGWTEADVLRNYPGLARREIQACLAYASMALRAEKVYPLAVPEA